MKRKSYIIVFTKSSLLDSFDYTKFHSTITTAPGVVNWWHYIDNAYIIITDSNTTATNVSDFVQVHMPNKHFIVSELNLKNHNGWLPKEAWDWINKYQNG